MPYFIFAVLILSLMVVSFYLGMAHGMSVANNIAMKHLAKACIKRLDAFEARQRMGIDELLFNETVADIVHERAMKP